MRPLLLLLLLGTPATASAHEWELITEDDGIKVWQRPVPGTSLVEFRGKTTLDASMKQILAVLADSKRKTEWMQNCVENRIVRASSVQSRVVYNRTGSTWPLVSDRDVVVKSSLQMWPDEGRVLIEARNTKDELAPEVDGVVRMPKLYLSWNLIAKSTTQTEVTYQVQADPGGSIPQWIVNLASKGIPFHTLANLRKQVKRDYDASLAIVEASFDWAKYGM